MSDIGLTPSVSNIILALQRINASIAARQAALATGLKTQNSLGGAATFIAQELKSQAARLQVRKDDIALGVTTLHGTLAAIDAIINQVESMKDIANAALADNDDQFRESSAEQFDDGIDQLNSLTNDAAVRGTNLIASSPSTLTVLFNEDGSSKLVVAGTALTASALGIDASADTWDDDPDIQAAITDLNDALDTLRATKAFFENNLALLETRATFTEELVAKLEEGAGKLVNADPNEEAAALLALQTRRDLSLTALSIAADSDRSIFKLFA
ncbi:MAG TPA: hypothetical protein VJB70_05270 [Candidatus Paceibacterota bacterium]